MSATTRILCALLAVIAAGVSAVAWCEYGEIGRIRADGLTQRADYARLQNAAQDSARKVRSLQDELTAAHSAEAAARAAGDRPALENRTLGKAAAEWLGRLSNPEIRRLTDVQRMAAIDRQFAAFFRTAHLSPDLLAQVRRLLLERQDANDDVLLATAQQGIDPMENSDEFRQMVRKAQSEVDGQIETALGPDVALQYVTYQQAQGARTVVSQIQQDLDGTAAPLTESQQQQLTQAITDSNLAGEDSINDKTIATAQTFLSAPQVQELQNMVALQQAAAQLRKLISQGGSGPPSSAPGG